MFVFRATFVVSSACLCRRAVRCLTSPRLRAELLRSGALLRLLVAFDVRRKTVRLRVDVCFQSHVCRLLGMLVPQGRAMSNVSTLTRRATTIGRAFAPSCSFRREEEDRPTSR